MILGLWTTLFRVVFTKGTPRTDIFFDEVCQQCSKVEDCQIIKDIENNEKSNGGYYPECEEFHRDIFRNSMLNTLLFLMMDLNIMLM